MQRPTLTHMTTSPNLSGYSLGSDQDLSKPEKRPSISRKSSQFSSSDTNELGHGSKAEDLFSQLKDRYNTEYRNICFRPQQKRNPDFEPRISFDTIDLQIKDDQDPDFADDEHALYRKSLQLEPDFRDSRGRGRDRDLLSVSPSGQSPGRSPGTSPSRMKSPSRVSFFGPQIQYPTSPIVTRRCSSIARMHKDFEDLYLGKLLKQKLLPALPGRVILIYISARKHTWVAIDWIMQNFIQNGDSIVIVASLPQPLGKSRSKQRHNPNESFAPKTEKIRQRQRSQPEFIKQIAMNIMNYALCVVNPKAICRVVVEIAEGKTKDVLKDMYKLYEPNIVCTGSRTNQKSSAPLRSWDSSRLSDRLVKNFPLPVIVVPALNLAKFEEELKSKISGAPVSQEKRPTTAESDETSTHEAKDSDVSRKLEDSEDSEDSDIGSISDESVSSEASADSESSAESYTSFDEIADLYSEYKSKVGSSIGELKTKERNEDYFANIMKAISDHSLSFCEELRGVDPDFKRKGALLAREITGSNLFGAVPYKTKSLLPPVEKAASHSGSATPGVSYRDLKKSLKMNAEKAKEKAASGNDGAEPPKSKTLKFADSEKPSREKKTRTRPLMKFLSNEDPSSRRVNIAPSTSHPDIRITPASDESEKKEKRRKKRNFWKIF